MSKSDIALNAAIIRRFYPGTDPWKLTLGEFANLLESIKRILELEAGPPRSPHEWFARNSVPGSARIAA